MSDLSPDDKAIIAEQLRQTIAADRFPLSHRIKALKTVIDNLEPPPLRPELPPLKPPGTPSVLLATKGRG